MQTEVGLERETEAQSQRFFRWRNRASCEGTQQGLFLGVCNATTRGLRSCTSELTQQDLLRAKKDLLRAKKEGRNRTCYASKKVNE